MVLSTYKEGRVGGAGGMALSEFSLITASASRSRRIDLRPITTTLQWRPFLEQSPFLPP